MDGLKKKYMPNYDLDTHLKVLKFTLHGIELGGYARLKSQTSEIHVSSTEDSQTKADSLSSRRAWRVRHSVWRFCAFALRTWR